MGDWPARSRASFASSTSMPWTTWPDSAKHVPATSPTYPVPMTVILIPNASAPHSSCKGLFPPVDLVDVSEERPCAVRGGVRAEHPLSRADSQQAPLGLAHLADVAEHVAAAARQQDLGARLEEFIDPGPHVTDHRHAAGSGLEEPDTR